MHDVVFARYLPSKYSVTSKLGVGDTQSSKMPPFNSSSMVSYSTSIATMAVSRTLAEIYSYWSKNAKFFSPPLVFGAPVRGEAVGVQQRPSVIRN